MLRRRLLSVLMAGVIAIGSALAAPGCTTNPATGRKQLVVISEKEEIAIGTKYAPQMLAESGGPIPDEPIQQYVSQIGMQMARLCERPDLPWTFHTLDSKVVNAFAFPGGKVFVSRGLLEKMTSEAQLAGVLGHEVGHVTAKHVNDRMVQQIGVSVVAVGTGVYASTRDEDWAKVLGVGVAAGGGLYLLKYSRDQEHESDDLGLRYMTRAGYDPMGQVQVMRILEEAGKGPRPPEFLSTHPEPGNRADRLEKIVREKYAHTQNNPSFVTKRAAFKANVLDRLDDLPPASHPDDQDDG
jgi:predicted Zn-dependent protease